MTHACGRLGFSNTVSYHDNLVWYRDYIHTYIHTFINTCVKEGSNHSRLEIHQESLTSDTLLQTMACCLIDTKPLSVTALISKHATPEQIFAELLTRFPFNEICLSRCSKNDSALGQPNSVRVNIGTFWIKICFIVQCILLQILSRYTWYQGKNDDVVLQTWPQTIMKIFRGMRNTWSRTGNFRTISEMLRCFTLIKISLKFVPEGPIDNSVRGGRTEGQTAGREKRCPSVPEGKMIFANECSLWPSVIDLGKYWLRQWLIALRHQAITPQPMLTYLWSTPRTDIRNKNYCILESSTSWDGHLCKRLLNNTWFNEFINLLSWIDKGYKC